MRLINFDIVENSIFNFVFDNGVQKKADIKNLLKDKVSNTELKTARINQEWGCLEFNDGMVDIEPKTLYNYTQSYSNK
jgi:hypothetical protein